MTYEVVLQETAIRSLEALYRTIAKDSPVNAQRYAGKLRGACETLSFFPRRCPLAFENGLSGYEIRHKIFDCYRIIFTIQEQTVHILEIRHAARRPFTSL